MIKELAVNGLKTLLLTEGNTVFVVRTPYNSDNYIPWMKKLNKTYGYSVLVQDVRGRYGSADEWIPYSQELADSSHLSVFLNSFNFSKIIILGSSYEAFCARVLANFLPSDRVSLVLRVGVRSQYESLYEKGILRYGDLFWWGITHGTGQKSQENEFQRFLNYFPNFYCFKNSHLKEMRNKFLTKYSPLQKEISFPNVPVLLIGGWNDGYLEYAFNDFKRWKNPNKQLIVGNFDHSLNNIGRIFDESAWYNDLIIEGDTAIVESQLSDVIYKEYSFFTEKILKNISYKSLKVTNETIIKNNSLIILKNDTSTYKIKISGLLRQIKLYTHNLIERNIFAQIVLERNNTSRIIGKILMEKNKNEHLSDHLQILIFERDEIFLVFSLSFFPKLDFDFNNAPYFLNIKKIVILGGKNLDEN